MRRGVIALGIVAILVSSCGQTDLPDGFATVMQERVALIRQTSEAGRPGYARAHLKELVAMVTSRLGQGRLDEGRALEILESAAAVADQLSFLPRRSSIESPSPPPQGEEGGGNSGQGNGDGGGDGDD